MVTFRHEIDLPMSGNIPTFQSQNIPRKSHSLPHSFQRKAAAFSLPLLGKASLRTSTRATANPSLSKRESNSIDSSRITEDTSGWSSKNLSESLETFMLLGVHHRRGIAGSRKRPRRWIETRKVAYQLLRQKATFVTSREGFCCCCLLFLAAIKRGGCSQICGVHASKMLWKGCK